MYTYVRALALSRSIGSQWTEVNLLNILVFDIFQTYSKVYLVLSNTELTDNVNVDMDVLKPLYSSYTEPLSSLLALLGNTALETVENLPNSNVTYAKYSDAVRAGYKIKPCLAGTIVPENYPAIELKDLRLTRDNYTTDMKLIHDYCLVSVNGFYHWTDSTTEAAYAFRGADTMRKSKLNHLGILSFLDVGKLTKVRINASNINPVTADSVLREKINFSVTESLDNKSYALVLGGYLIFPQEGVFWRSGEHGFTLDINRISYVERLMESSQYLDLSDMGLTQSTLGDNVYSTDELLSDDKIKRYMTLSQSFLVLIDVPNLVVNKIHIRRSNLPGMFTSYQDPVYPLVVGYGKVAEYWKVMEDGYWAVNIQDSYSRNYVLSEQPLKNGRTITDNLNPNNPFFHGRGFLLEVAGYRT